MKWSTAIKIINVLTVVIIGAATMRYAVAFQAAEPPLDFWGIEFEISPITALFTAIPYELAIALGIWGVVNASKRRPKYWWAPAVTVILQILAGLWIVAPVLRAGLTNDSVTDVIDGFLLWVWAATVTAGPWLALATMTLTLSVAPSRYSEDNSDNVKTSSGGAATQVDSASTATDTVSDDGRQSWRYEDFVQRVANPVELSGQDVRQLAKEAGRHPRTVQRWRAKAIREKDVRSTT